MVEILAESKGTIVVLAHERVDHLRECLRAIDLATNREHYRLVIVVDGGNDELRKLVAASGPDSFVWLRELTDFPARVGILRSIRHGLATAFDSYDSDIAVVIEDDIVISRDFLLFVEACMESHSRRQGFRAVNGFGLDANLKDLPQGTVETTRLNYGVGWGWAIPHRTYKSMKPLLNLRGDYHVWDALIEPLLRSGYVVNPRVSQIRNIGFDDSATHTKNDFLVGKELNASYSSRVEQDVNFLNTAESKLSFRWREDAVAIDALSVGPRAVTFFVGAIFLHTHKIRLDLEEKGFRSTAAPLRLLLRLIRKKILPALGRASGSSSVFSGDF